MQVVHMKNNNDLKSVDSGNWFDTLITRSEKNTALDLCTQFLLYSLIAWPRVWVAGFHSKKSSNLSTVRPKTILYHHAKSLRKRHQTIPTNVPYCWGSLYRGLCRVRCYSFDPSVVSIGAVRGRLSTVIVHTMVLGDYGVLTSWRQLTVLCCLNKYAALICCILKIYTSIL